VTSLPRVIPCLPTDGVALVKTVRFQDPTYLGDPANVMSIFSELEVDELLLLDIAATPDDRGPNVELLRRVAGECLIPLGYGGGITTVDQASSILEIGLEKVVINTALARDPSLITRIAERHGSQAVVASIDARIVDGRRRAVTACGTQVQKESPVELARRAAEAGAGEILVTSIDREGTGSGYDLPLIRAISEAVHVPAIASGGAGSRRDLVPPIRDAGATAVAAGSIFVFYGRRRAVLINFPSRKRLRELFLEPPPDEQVA
jgi:imidazole glycerol-phosphate synthase subunit HisF